MASYLRPRRGKKATAIAQLTASAPLKRGEVFFEVPDAGTGTGAGKIKMGDGSTAYESLPYFLEPFDPDSATVGFTDATAAESDPYTTNATHANAIVPTANFKTIFTNLKQLLLNYNSQFTKLNNDLGNLPYKSIEGSYTGKSAKKYVEICKLNLDAGAWILIGFVDGEKSINSIYNIAFMASNDLTHTLSGNVRANMSSGGGITNCCLLVLPTNQSISLVTYDDPSFDSNTFRGVFYAIKISNK